MGAAPIPDKDSLFPVAGTVHEAGIDILVRDIRGTDPASFPSNGGGVATGELGGTLYVSIHLISSAIVKVLLVAVPTLSIPPAVFAPVLVKVVAAVGTVVIT